MLQKALPTLEEVQKQFKNWRRRRKNRRAQIPSALWEAAASLSVQYSVHKISKCLHLNHTALRDRVAGGAIKPQAPAFVELDMISSHASVNECIIEIEKADARMKISIKGNYPDIAEISKAFLG